jgi:prepilin-type N-terminal cleavage/methylation domain-containing protein
MAFKRKGSSMVNSLISCYPSCSACHKQIRSPVPLGLTMLEILVSVAIIAVLTGIAFPILTAIRHRSNISQTQSAITSIDMALDAYAQEDDRHRYPMHEELFVGSPTAPYAVSNSSWGSYGGGLVGLLMDHRLLTFGGGVRLDATGRLVDAWHEPYYYELKRPSPASHADRLNDWNWDAQAGRESRWDQVRNQASPYPYIRSLGPGSLADDAAAWIYHAP